MRVAVSVPSVLFPEGGVGTYVRNLLRKLPNVSQDNDEFLLFASREIESFLPLQDPHFTLKDRSVLIGNRSLRLLWEQTLFPLESLLHRVDVAHAMMFVAPLFPLSKTIVTIYDMTFFSIPEVHLKSKANYFRTMIPRTAKRAKAIIAISEKTKKDICFYLNVPEHKVRVIHLAPDESFYVVRDANVIQPVLERWAISSPYILFVGTIEPRKNVERLLEAYSLCKARYNIEHKLVLVGRKGWHFNLDQKIRDLGITDDVIFTGIVPLHDLVMIYNGADVFIYPSLYEGFGIPILEAMACGVPVITSNNSGTAEVAGNAAVLISPESVEEIVHAINDILFDREKQCDLAAKGVARSKNFSWKKTAKKTMDLYRDVSQGLL